MARKKIGRRGSGKSIIRVFCEGESEQAYTEFLKQKFCDVAVINYPKEIGLFDRAKNRFDKDPLYREYKDVIDEVWFFFDVETKDIDKWDERYRIINYLRKLRKDKNIRVRLLMTTGCIEYWFMLHRRYYTPSLQTVAEKEKVILDIKTEEPLYEKGNKEITAKIAADYPVAVRNAKKTMKRLLDEGMPGLEDTDTRNQWLYRKCLTFSNVFEAIEYLESMRNNKEM